MFLCIFIWNIHLILWHVLQKCFSFIRSDRDSVFVLFSTPGSAKNALVIDNSMQIGNYDLQYVDIFEKFNIELVGKHQNGSCI